jgi:hypothetical protein
MAALTKAERLEKVAEWLKEKTDADAVEMAMTEWGMTENTAKNYVEQAKGEEPPNPKEPEHPKVDGYQPKDGEENTVIVEVEQRSFNPQTGEKESTAKNVTFTSVGEWNNFIKPIEIGARNGEKVFTPQYKLLGYSVNKVVYIPKGYKPVEADPWIKGKDAMGRAIPKPLVRQ